MLWHIALVFLVASSPWSSASAAGMCFWVEGLDWCTGTDDGPHGEDWAYRAAAFYYCVSNSFIVDGHFWGCGPGINRTICKDVSNDHLPEGETYCEPVFSNIPKDRDAPLSCLTAPNTEQCEKDRQILAEGLGCPECITAFNAGQELQLVCMSGFENKDSCEGVNPGPIFDSGPFPASLLTTPATSSASTVLSKCRITVLLMLFAWCSLARVQVLGSLI